MYESAMTDQAFFDLLEKKLHYEKIMLRKDQVYVLSCGTNTYTWFQLEGASFTIHQTSMESPEGGIANSIWRKGDMIHSLHDDLMLPIHALSDGVMARFLSKDVNEIIKADPELTWYLTEYYYKRFRFTLENFQHAALDSSDDRLRYMEKRFADMEELGGERVSDSILAMFLGMHRVSISRLRKKLKNQ